MSLSGSSHNEPESGGRAVGWAAQNPPQTPPPHAPGPFGRLGAPVADFGLPLAPFAVPLGSLWPSFGVPLAILGHLWARPGPGADLGGSRVTEFTVIEKKTYDLAEMELTAGSAGSARSVVSNCGSEPPFHARWGSG